MILAGDIGGTKTNLALFEQKDNSLSLVAQHQFPSKQFTNLNEIITLFKQRISVPSIDAVCFGIAGPVIEGRCRTTNLPWDITTSGLQEYLGIQKVRLLNDLEATAYGMLHLGEDEFVDLNPKGRKTNANRAIIAAGTGLGANWTDDLARRRIRPGPGGSAGRVGAPGAHPRFLVVALPHLCRVQRHAAQLLGHGDGAAGTHFFGHRDRAHPGSHRRAVYSRAGRDGREPHGKLSGLGLWPDPGRRRGVYDRHRTAGVSDAPAAGSVTGPVCAWGPHTMWRRNCGRNKRSLAGMVVRL